MMAETFLSNLFAYSTQVACVIALGGLAARAGRVQVPRVRYAFWRILLAICLLLPVVQERQYTTVSALRISGMPSAPGPVIRNGATVMVASRVTRTQLLVAVLAVGMLVRLTWVGYGALHLRRLRRCGRLATLSAEDTKLRQRLAVGADVRYMPNLQQPITFGVRRPLVLLPDRLAREASDIQHAVLCHELLHVQRRDWVWVIAEEIVRAVLWFHPAIWWLISRIRLSREEVVDELAVRETGQRRSYVRALLAFSDEAPLALASAFVRRRHLFDRIMRISKVAVMSPRRMALSCAVLAMVVVMGSWGAISAFPLRASVTDVNALTGLRHAMSPPESLPLKEHALALPLTQAGRQTAQTDLSKLDTPSQPIALQFQKASVGAILEFLGRAGGIRMEIGPGVNDAVAPVNVKFTNAKFVDVLSFIVTATASKLNYTVIDSKTLRVSVKRP